MRAHLLSVLVLLLIHNTLFGQDKSSGDSGDLPLRVEIPVKSDQETYQVVPMGSGGAMVFYRANSVAEGESSNWYFAWYNEHLEQRWVKSIVLPAGQEPLFTRTYHDTLFILFCHAGKSKGGVVPFRMVRVVPGDGSFILNPGTIGENQRVVSFSVSGSLAWLGINSQTGVGAFRHIHLQTGYSRSFSLGEGDVIAIRWAMADTIASGINAIVARPIGKKVTENYFVHYDTSGRISNECLLNINSANRRFSHFRGVQTGAGTFLILGSYGQGHSGMKKEEEELSAGFFAISIDGKVQRSINFYNFLELKNASSLLTDKEMMAIRKKSLKKGGNVGEYSLDYPLMFREIVRVEGGYLLNGEVYTAQFRTESYTDFDFYGRPYTNSYSVFDGYRFQNGLLAAFDKEGRMQWDNVLEIRNLRSMEPTPKVAVLDLGQEMVLSYLYEGKIGYKIILRDSVKEKTNHIPLEMMYPQDKLVQESRSRMVHWYGSYYLCYGYQEIKNISLAANNKRTVFFLNKVRFEE